MDHKHHIIPKHEWKRRFGNLKGFNDPNNIVYLTVEQHAEVHKWLWEEQGFWQDKLAWIGLSGQIDTQEIIREKQRLANLGSNNHFFGKHRTEEHKIKVSRKMTGIKRSEETLSHFYKEYIVTFPDGKEESITGLRKFCREHKINCGAMTEVANGHRKQHKGFVCRRING